MALLSPLSQDSDAEPRQLSLAALFGPQSQPKQAGSGGGRPGGPRPAVARSLSYEEPSRPPSDPPSQHCPAIQKLMSTQRGPAEVLQPVSESPENRLCQNGSMQPAPHPSPARDPLHGLFQNPPPPLLQTPLLYGQPSLGGGPHHPAAKPLFFSPGKPQLALPAPMLPQLASSGPMPPQLGPPGTGVVSPHELLQRLQLVQQEQSLSVEPLRPALAPRFQEPLPQPRPQPLAARALDGWGDKPSGPVAPEKPNPLYQVTPRWKPWGAGYRVAIATRSVNLIG